MKENFWFCIQVLANFPVNLRIAGIYYEKSVFP